MKTISNKKYEKARKTVEGILQEYSFKEIKDKRNEYQRTHDEELRKSLKKFNSLYKQLNNNKTTIKQYERQQNLIPDDSDENEDEQNPQLRNPSQRNPQRQHPQDPPQQQPNGNENEVESEENPPRRNPPPPH